MWHRIDYYEDNADLDFLTEMEGLPAELWLKIFRLLDHPNLATVHQGSHLCLSI